MSNQIWTPEYFQEKIVSRNNSYNLSEDEDTLISSEPENDYGFDEWSEPDYIE